MLAVNFAISTANAHQDTIDVQKTEQKIASQPDEMPVGSELKLCDDCPTFVKVPSTPDNLRNIQYVSKYELTWKNYMLAYDDGTCSIPDLWNRRARLVTANPDLYRVDWPIDMLQPKDIKCYFDWLSQKSNFKFDIPTEEEWTWFAYAGAITKYPWGDEIDLSKIAMNSLTTKVEDYHPQPYNYAARNIRGLKVGLFPPNNWGLYDTIGNLRELTVTTFSGGKLSINNDPISSFNGNSLAMKGYEWYLTKGVNNRHSEWIERFKAKLAQDSLDSRLFTAIKNGQFSYTPAIRIIILGDK